MEEFAEWKTALPRRRNKMALLKSLALLTSFGAASALAPGEWVLLSFLIGLAHDFHGFYMGAGESNQLSKSEHICAMRSSDGVPLLRFLVGIKDVQLPFFAAIYCPPAKNDCNPQKSYNKSQTAKANHWKCHPQLSGDCAFVGIYGDQEFKTRQQAYQGLVGVWMFGLSLPDTHFQGKLFICERPWGFTVVSPGRFCPRPSGGSCWGAGFPDRRLPKRQSLRGAYGVRRWDVEVLGNVGKADPFHPKKKGKNDTVPDTGTQKQSQLARQSRKTISDV